MKKNFVTYSALILISSLLIDYFKIGLITTSEDYIHSIYTALVTVSTLGATILTILANNLNENTLGFKAKELMNLESDYLKLSTMIHSIFILIFLGTIFLALNYQNSVTGTLIVVFILMGTQTKFVWDIISDEEFVVKYLLNHISKLDVTDISNQRVVIDRIFDALRIASNHGLDNLKSRFKVIKPLIRIEDTKNENTAFLEEKIRKITPFFVEKFGYTLGIKSAFELIDLLRYEQSLYDRLELISNPILDIRYQYESDILDLSVENIPSLLEDLDFLNRNELVNVQYDLFNSIYLNTIISKDFKHSLLVQIIEHLVTYNFEKSNQNSAKQLVLLKVFKDFVLTNINEEESRMFIDSMSKASKKHIVYNDEKFMQTLGLLYFSTYIYSITEVELITSEHREKIELLFSYENNNNINNEKISLRKLINENFAEIFRQIINLDNEMFDDFGFMDYFPEYINHKSTVWSYDALVEFTFMNYLMSHYELGFMFDAYKTSSSEEILTVLINLFDSKKRISDSVRNKIASIARLLNQKSDINVSIQENLFGTINESLKQIKNKNLKREAKQITLKTDEINTQIKHEFLKNFFGYNDSLDLSDAQTLFFKPIIVRKNLKEVSFIKSRIINYLNSFLDNEVTNYKIKFNLIGVKSLLKILNNSNFNLRNYTFVDDLALSSSIRQTKEYLELKKIILNMKVDETYPFRTRLFFRSNFLEYNIEISRYELFDLSDEECTAFAENFKSTDGLFYYNQVYYGFSEIVEVIKNDFGKEVIHFMFKANIDKQGCISIN
jgi:hypothetical protein